MFFISFKKEACGLGSKFKCTICNEEETMQFNPMDEWQIKGPLCGKCYSKQLADYYPGKHVRINKE